MTEKKRVGIWVRVSSEIAVENESPQHHEKRARNYIEAKGWIAVTVYRLDAMTGKSVMEYAETKRMLADIRSGHITGLVFSKLARLARNTKELLEFADIFQANKADLVSLAESIDTSTPAGRLFYTMIAAMAEWEREEIASRVSASIPIRAKLGKNIGGQPSLGYKWENKELIIDAAEAPLRKLIYELFLKYQRQATTANALNELGYRTRNGKLFSRSGVCNLLRDPMAKGERRAAYTKRSGRNRQWTMKPKEEWIIVPCPAIVSEELWNQCNHILDEQEKRTKRPGPKAVHLLSGLVKCNCGKSMYVFHRSMVYTCKGCGNRIAMDDIDEIYQAHLKDYLANINASPYLEQSDRDLRENKKLLETTTIERNKLAKTMDTIIQLRVEGELTKERFKAQYDPLELRLSQLDAQLPELEAEIDARTIYLHSSETIVHEAWNLSEQWHHMAFEQKRGIVEIITNEIIIDKQDITIRLAYIPPPSLNDGKSVRHPRDARGSGEEFCQRTIVPMPHGLA